ncbi:S8 family serine peptidase [Pedobacter sp. PLR]|uniref:S8 family serine peptidase n=1 Tax=Pedobacter sp. PLR TaxID=2994465 RepID=UPI002246773C|nr:S8 family serine peptidase [Pedobacter sp. PLR]MCX2452620.1 S8 family serine peptidase [Pedobacter sp. PLR]
MKKQTLILALCLQGAVLAGNAQLVKKAATEKKTEDWYNLSFEKEGVYGIGVNQAYEFLKGKPLKKKPVVAVIGYGMDATHEDLKNASWTNPNEKEDGIDNDGNGYIDDIHGWNFLGNSKGEMIEKTNQEGDREYFRLRGLYEGIYFSGTDYFKFNELLQKPVKVPAPKDLKEYAFFRTRLNKESRIAQEASGIQFSKIFKYMIVNEIEPAMKKINPDLTKIKQADLTKYDFNTNGKADTLKLMSKFFLLMTFGVNNSYAGKNNTDSMNFVQARDLTLNPKKVNKNLENLLAENIDARKITGDDWTNITDKNYGNNKLYSNGSFSGTMISGIIAADRSNGVGVNGIMPEAQLMSLRAYPKEGEPYYKDIALAIRYAVDQKADVIQLGLSNTIYPAYEAKWVNDALLYAEEKGVLVVSSVWNLSDNLSEKKYYPNAHVNGKVLNNFITVAASDKEGMPLKDANFSAKELDLFAPGQNISTTYMGGTYRMGASPLFAGASVAGTAALIKAYYPEITAAQLRKLIVGNVTDRASVEVEKQVKVGGKMNTDLYLFSQLCVSGGILNAYKAVLAADQLSKTTGK